MTWRAGRIGGGAGGDSCSRPPVPSCFKHYDRVLVGARREKGRLLHCEKRDGSGKFWKVKTDAGVWLWPDVLILDGPGPNVAICEAGGGRFATDQHGDGLLCPKHSGEIFGTPEDHARDAEADKYRPRGNTHKWKRGRR